MINPATIAGGGGAERVPHDFYPTPPEATVALVDWLGPHAPKKVLEPACGNGDMAEVLIKAGFDVTARDLRHTGYGEGGRDFLAEAHSAYPFNFVITNPPFKLAEQFIKTAHECAEVVCMLLKATYWNAASRQALFNHYRPQAVLPLTWRPAFQPEKGKSPTMDVMWCVWDRQELENNGQIYQPLEKPSPQRMAQLNAANDNEVLK